MSRRLSRWISSCRANPKVRWRALEKGFFSRLLGQQGTKPIAQLRQKEIFSLSKKFVKSNYLWQRRLALGLLESYAKNPGSCSFTLSIVKQLENDKEYYVKKAVEWTKRNLEKYK